MRTLLLTLFAVAAAAQTPDFTGIWSNPTPQVKYKSNINQFDPARFAPLKPGAEAIFYEPRTGDPRHDEPRAFCMPSGFPSGMLAPYPVQIVQTKDYVIMVHEFQRTTRIITLNKREHNPDLERSYYGDSIGRWDGDTLVIDTVNFKRWSLDDHYYDNPKEFRMHSEELHTIERLHRTNAKTIRYELTIDDPKIFTKPWSEEFIMTFHPEWEKIGLLEFVCQENNRCEGGKCQGN